MDEDNEFENFQEEDNEEEDEEEFEDSETGTLKMVTLKRIMKTGNLIEMIQKKTMKMMDLIMIELCLSNTFN